MSPPKFITTAEAAGILQVSPGWVAALCRKGVLDGRKEGGIWLINAASVNNADADDPVDPEIMNRVKEKLQEDKEVAKVGTKTASDSLKDKIIDIIKNVAKGVALGAGSEIGKVIVAILRGFFGF